jgi:hypothetical protein
MKEERAMDLQAHRDGMSVYVTVEKQCTGNMHA